MYCRARACPGVFGVEDQGADHSGRLAEVVHEGVEIARGTDRHVDLPQLVLIAVATAFCYEAYRTPQLGPSQLFAFRKEAGDCDTVANEPVKLAFIARAHTAHQPWS